MITSDVPFNGRTQEQLFYNIINTPIIDTLTRICSIPPEMFDLLVLLLDKDSETRPYPIEVIFHPFLVNNSDDSLDDEEGIQFDFYRLAKKYLKSKD